MFSDAESAYSMSMRYHEEQMIKEKEIMSEKTEITDDITEDVKRQRSNE